MTGRLETTPPFFTTQHTTSQLFNGFNAGFKISGGAIENAFDALLAALTPPRVAVLASGCGTCAAPNSCVNGFCLTPNAAFRRPGASIEVLAFTDEDDQSTPTAAQTAQRLRSLVDPLLGHFVRYHALIPTGSCKGSNSFTRHEALIAATAGTTHDLCSNNYGPAMKDLATRTFAGLDRFYLSRKPVPTTIVVKVDGVTTTTTTYNAAARAVVFATPPADGADIEVSYTVNCN